VDGSGLFLKKMPDWSHTVRKEKTKLGFKASKVKLKILLGVANQNTS
jgi:hypothetical protein